jgi:hypothetical protein
MFQMVKKTFDAKSAELERKPSPDITKKINVSNP